MDINYIRSSSFSNFNLCGHQYFLSYNLGIPQRPNIRAECGTIFHKVMECLANCKKCEQDGTDSFTDDALGQIGKGEMWNDKFVTSITDSSFNYYSGKSPNTFTETHKIDIHKWVKKTLLFKEGMFDPRKRNIIGAEIHFDFEVEEDWAVLSDGSRLRMKGTIDLVTQINHNTYESIDWKTGKRMDWGTGEEKDFAKLMNDPQLKIYHYALSKLFPDIQQFFPTIYYVNAGGPFTLPFERKEIPAIKEQLRDIFVRIRDCKLPILKSNGEHFFCSKICSYFKDVWNEKSTCNLCHEIHRSICKNGMDYVVKKYTSKKHNISNYQNPGS
jgi:hypothetical protein